MDLTAITDRGEISSAYKRFAKSLKAAAKTYERVVGWQGGSEEHTVYWHSTQSLSVVLAPNPDGNRSWNVFGTVDPLHVNNLGIICEINFPHEGVDRRVAGVFAKADDGRIFVTHSGKIGGGRSGIGKSAFTDAYRGPDQWVKIHWPHSADLTDGLVISELADPHLVEHISYFVREVERFKSAAVNEQSGLSGDEAQKLSQAVTFTPEFAGEKKPYKPGSLVTARCNHGLVVSALRDAIEASRGQRRYCCGNNRFRDLYIAQGSRMLALFEVKTDLSSTNVYEAVGQLLLNGADEYRRPISVLVVPGVPKATTAARLERIGLRVLPYSWKERQPIFPKLAEILHDI